MANRRGGRGGSSDAFGSGAGGSGGYVSAVNRASADAATRRTAEDVANNTAQPSKTPKVDKSPAIWHVPEGAPAGQWLHPDTFEPLKPEDIDGSPEKKAKLAAAAAAGSRNQAQVEAANKLKVAQKWRLKAPSQLTPDDRPGDEHPGEQSDFDETYNHPEVVAKREASAVPGIPAAGKRRKGKKGMREVGGMGLAVSMRENFGAERGSKEDIEEDMLTPGRDTAGNFFDKRTGKALPKSRWRKEWTGLKGAIKPPAVGSVKQDFADTIDGIRSIRGKGTGNGVGAPMSPDQLRSSLQQTGSLLSAHVAGLLKEPRLLRANDEHGDKTRMHIDGALDSLRKAQESMDAEKALPKGATGMKGNHLYDASLHLHRAWQHLVQPAVYGRLDSAPPIDDEQTSNLVQAAAYHSPGVKGGKPNLKFDLSGRNKVTGEKTSTAINLEDPEMKEALGKLLASGRITPDQHATLIKKVGKGKKPSTVKIYGAKKTVSVKGKKVAGNAVADQADIDENVKARQEEADSITWKEGEGAKATTEDTIDRGAAERQYEAKDGPMGARVPTPGIGAAAALEADNNVPSNPRGTKNVTMRPKVTEEERAADFAAQQAAAKGLPKVEKPGRKPKADKPVRERKTRQARRGTAQVPPSSLEDFLGVSKPKKGK